MWWWLWLLRRRHHSPGGHGSERLWYRWWSLPLHLCSIPTTTQQRLPKETDSQRDHDPPKRAGPLRGGRKDWAAPAQLSLIDSEESDRRPDALDSLAPIHWGAIRGRDCRGVTISSLQPCAGAGSWRSSSSIPTRQIVPRPTSLCEKKQRPRTDHAAPSVPFVMDVTVGFLKPRQPQTRTPASQ